MVKVSDEEHARLCEEPAEECGRCARIQAERAAERRIAEEKEEHAVREALGWLAQVG